MSAPAGCCVCLLVGVHEADCPLDEEARLRARLAVAERERDHALALWRAARTAAETEAAQAARMTRERDEARVEVEAVKARLEFVLRSVVGEGPA